MKAIIPVAGAGTKLRPHTYTQPKALIPLAGKTILSIIIDQLHEAGIREFIFIVGYLGNKIQDYVTETYPDLSAKFVHQSDRQGTGQAIYLTREWVGDDDVMIVLGDTICEYDVQEVVKSPVSMLGVKRVEDPRHFGVAELEEDGNVLHVVEKPQIPKSNMALVGIYKICETKVLYDCLHSLIVNNQMSHGEFNLTDALDCMIAKGVKLHSFRVNAWFDCGKKETLLESNAILLKKFGGKVADSGIFENAIIIPPVSIAAGCTIRNSIIGPNVTIGAACTLEHSIIQNSILGAYTKLNEIVLTHSLIGSDSLITGARRSLNIGDNTELDLGKSV